MVSSLHYRENRQDVGGLSNDEHPSTGQSVEDAAEAPLSAVIEKSHKPTKFWEFQTHALQLLLAEKKLINAAELRRHIEALPMQAFARKTYYEKWAAAMAASGIERGNITQLDLDIELGLQTPDTPAVLYQPGDYVRVKEEDAGVRYRKPHLRTPGYLFGVVGWIASPTLGYMDDPDVDSRPSANAPKQPAYRVAFSQKDLWEGYAGSDKDTLQIEIWQSWLEKASKEDLEYQQTHRAKLDIGHHDHHQSHHEKDDHHGHDHVHEERYEVEQKAVDAEGDGAERSRLTQALVKIYTAKGVVTAAQLASKIEALESLGKQSIGLRIVARAWTDPDFKARLLDDGISAAVEVGASTAGYPARGGYTEASPELTGNILKVVEDTPSVFNVIVCTLCSCYPVPILGLSPSWYKARSYRARVVRDPRGVLKEFGTIVPDNVSIVVHDSNADTRFIKIPLRPQGTEGWTAEQLEALVTRDSVIGVRYPNTPQELKRQKGAA